MDIVKRSDAKSAGLKRYFTGRPCSKGHSAERTVCDHACVECSRRKSAAASKKPDRMAYMREYQRDYRNAHPDRIKATRDCQDKSRLAEHARARRAQNPEPHKAALRRSFQKHKATRLAETRAWKAANKQATSNHMRAAKAKRRAAEGSFTRDDVETMLVEQCGVCAACPANISESYHVDHMTPLARGGTNWPDNLQLLCPACNRSKGAKTMAEWMAWKIEVSCYSGFQRCSGSSAAGGVSEASTGGAGTRTK